MRTLVIQALEPAVGVFPKVGFTNVKITKGGNGTGNITVVMSTTGQSFPISIDGGKIIRNATESNTYNVPNTAGEVSFQIRVDSKFAYLYIPTDKQYKFIQLWNLNTVNSPIVDYTSFSKNLENSRIMFQNASTFNQNISNWDVSKITTMYGMFWNALAFNRDISSWNFNKEVDLGNFMSGKSSSNYNATYYDNLLIKLASIDWTGRAQPKVLGMGSIKYTSAGASARAILVSGGWTITDGGVS